MRVRKRSTMRLMPLVFLAVAAASVASAQTAMPLSLKRAVEIALAPRIGVSDRRDLQLGGEWDGLNGAIRLHSRI